MASMRILGCAFGLIVLLIATGASAEPPAEVPPGDIAALVAAPNGPLLLDVRTADEFAQGHVPGALSIPIAELPDRLHQIAAYKKRGVVAYCESGGRAQRAIDILDAAGFENLKLLAGSMKAWRAEDRATEK